MPGNENVPPPSDKAIDIDVVFLQDCTQSQQPYIDAVRQHLKEAIPMIKSQADLKGGTARYRVIAFRDHLEQDCDWLLKQYDFTDNSSVLAGNLAELIASGGGDGPEAQFDGLDAARRSSWRLTAKRIVILMTDSPPHGIGEPGDSVPSDHPGALNDKVILNTYKKKDIHLNVLGCVPEITYYDKAESFYKGLTQDTGGLYVALPEPQANFEAMKRAIVGCVLYSTNSLRTTDRFANYIMDNSHRGHDAIVNEIHSKLLQEGAKCHKVSCSEHRGVNDVQYSLGNVDRDHVDSIVRKTLRYQADVKANPHMYDQY